MQFGYFTDTKLISQAFSDCGLHNDEYTKYQPIENCVFRASIKFGQYSDSNIYLFI